MKILLIAPFLFTLNYCSAQTGTISGNVFYKYNDYVGNRADAGSNVYLFTTDTSKNPKETFCDLNGNFKFENLKAGKYGVVVVSKVTNTKKGEDNFFMFASDKGVTKKYFNFSFNEFKEYQLLSDLIHRTAELSSNYHENRDRIEVMRDSINILENIIFKKAYNKSAKNAKNALLWFTIESVQMKMFFKEIDLKSGESESVVVDFKTTYVATSGQ